MQLMEISNIKILSSFAESIPKEEKLKACRDFWDLYHEQDRYLVVNKNNELIDGYIQYLILKENNVSQAEVKFSNTKRSRWKRKSLHILTEEDTSYRTKQTTYIYGIHPNDKGKREYVWRVPDSWTGWENDLLPGDAVIVRTKHGLAPVIVTKISWLDVCPVDMPVRKVYRKLEIVKEVNDSESIYDL